LDLADGVIEALDQELEERGQFVGLHLGDDLECRLAPVKFVNQWHRSHRAFLRAGAGSVPCPVWLGIF